ncbi:MAG: anti-sigma factor antagonist [Xenococcaceae cyanobacterium MO_207.B15]|nr:anti-sigma factor antagonist [Xenococcaceae cyanobacterium MO_207.B15]MDJ0745104.1 anti-sigma factor antagonist [Xenococcaceae cyanobacterium MO_167.B27]
MSLNITLETTNDTAKIFLSGELDGNTANSFQEKIEEITKFDLNCLVLIMENLEYMASAGLRVLIFAKQKMGPNVDVYIVGAQEMVVDTIKKTGFHHSIILLDEYV